MFLSYEAKYSYALFIGQAGYGPKCRRGYEYWLGYGLLWWVWVGPGQNVSPWHL